MPSRLSSFSASFHDYELSLDYYHGKDLLHSGNLLKLDPEYSWERINGKIRNKIRKAQQLGATIKRVEGSAQDIKDFRSIWFDPEDETIPESLEPEEFMYMAYLNDVLVGGLILSPSSPKTLYMHNLGANEEGKRNNIPALLLWNAVEELKDSEYDYIDVGVSFRPTLYTFFRNWQTDSYPIIFNPPFIRPDIRLTPFEARFIDSYKADASPEARKVLTEYFGDTFTILPRAIYCIKAVLKHIGVGEGDNVAVYKTFDNEYLSRCVSDPIESLCEVSRSINDKTKAVLVVHEFGYPYKDLKALKKTCGEKGIPLIEDCAWTYGTQIDSDTKVGEVGDYAIFSLPKVLPVQYGGVLKGLEITDEDNWNKYQLLDYFKRELVINKVAEYLPNLAKDNDQRRKNWQYLKDLFAKDGFETFSDLPEGVYPGAFVVRLANFQEAFERYEEFGVEAGRYYQGEALYLPVHQNLTIGQLDYIYGVFRGKLNLSSGYRRDSKKS